MHFAKQQAKMRTEKDRLELQNYHKNTLKASAIRATLQIHFCKSASGAATHENESKKSLGTSGWPGAGRTMCLFSAITCAK